MRGSFQRWSVGLSAVVCFLTVGLVGGMAFEAFADIANLPAGFTSMTCVSGVATPNRLAVGPKNSSVEGYLYIVDYEATPAIGDADFAPDYIKRVDPNCGNLETVYTFTSYPTYPKLTDIALKPDGSNLYSAHASGNFGVYDGAIVKFSSVNPGATPSYLTPNPLPVGTLFGAPTGIAFAPNGFGSYGGWLIAVDVENDCCGGPAGSGRIWAIHPDTGVIVPVTSAGATILGTPIDLDFCPDGNMYVVDPRGSLSSSGGRVARVKSDGTVELIANLYWPFDIACHPITGDLYVIARVSTNPHEHEIKKVNPSTGAITTFATAYGASDLEAEEVGGGGGGLVFSLDGSTLYVSEPGNDQVVKITGSFGPTITNISPSSSAVHTPVTITGSNFGSTQGGSTVTFNGLTAQVISWSDTSIQVRVPLIATPNGNSTSAAVKVTVASADSNTQSFTVIRGILFTSGRDGNNEIYIMNPDGSGQTRLTDNGAPDEGPAWSPDGTKISFGSLRTGNSEIFMMNVDGSGILQLTSNSADDAFPAWSSDGTKVLFRSDRDGNDEIYVMNTDGTSQINLTNNAAIDDWPSWSPDSSKVIFATERDGNREIYTMNADGSGLVRLTNNAASDDTPKWSPDGTKVVFQTYRDGNWEIYVMNVNGSNQTRITNNAFNEFSPAWSPDGTKIAFDSTETGFDEIFVMNADGTGRTNLSNNSAFEDWPSWASGGSISPPTTFTLTVNSIGAGSGTITATGIDCGSDCSEQYNSNTVVTVTAAAGANSVFAGWANCDSPSGAQCTMTMNADKTVTATFNLTPANITATKEDSDPNGSPYKPGDTIKYTVVLSNTGGAALNDGPGDEFTDTITSVATLNAAGTASSGTLTINPSIKKVTWNGSIPAGNSVTLTFSVRIPLGVIGTQRFCNQGVAKDGSGGAVLTTDPTPLAGAGTQTCVDVIGKPDLGIPLTLHGIEALLVRDRMYFNALGTGIKEIYVRIFSLAGKRVYASNWVENGHEWSLQNTAGRRVANGIYLYVMSVKGYDGQIRTQVKKLVIQR